MSRRERAVLAGAGLGAVVLGAAIGALVGLGVVIYSDHYRDLGQ